MLGGTWRTGDQRLQVSGGESLLWIAKGQQYEKGMNEAMGAHGFTVQTKHSNSIYNSLV